MLNDEALAILAAGRVLEDCAVPGALTLRALSEDDDIRVPIVIRNAVLGALEAPACQFGHPVVLDNVVVEGDVDFFAGYFFEGFRASRSHFGGTVDFQCGGHNRGPAVFSLDQCDFAQFVNFFDCWYEGPVAIRNCLFHAGSNLLGNVGAPFQVRFDVPPKVTGNVGRVDLNGRSHTA